MLKSEKYLFKILNVPTLTNELTGSLYRHAHGINNDLENVIIISNGIDTGRKNGVETGLINVNIEIKSNSNGTPKLSRFEVLAKIVRDLLNENNRLSSKGFYFDIENEQLFEQQKQENQYYFNFKITTK